MIKNTKPLPIWSKEDDCPVEGSFFNIPDICDKAKRNRCRRYYEKIKLVKGFHICPMGLSSYSSGEEFDDIITAVRIVDTYINSKIKKSNSFLPTLPKPIVLDSIYKVRKSNTCLTSPSNLAEGKAEDKHLVDFSLHEVRKFNRQIKRCSEEVLSKINKLDVNYLEDKVKSIFASSSMMSVRLDIYDFEMNPDVIISNGKISANIYKKFDKARRVLSVFAKDSKVGFSSFKGNCYHEIEIYPVFDFLPFVILENAIKYSPQDQDICVEFEDEIADLTITISSMGPRNSSEELDEIFNKGSRGKNAQLVDNGGGGYGLYFGHLICDIHDIKMVVDSGRNITLINGIEYADFVVKLIFTK